MIEWLQLKNFKGHRDLRLEFPPGLTLISGPNYSGKSTILHALLFALGGVSMVPGGSKKVPTRGVSSSAVQVSVGFFHRGQSYAIERRPSTAVLTRNGQPIATGTSPVNKEIERIIGMPMRYFLDLKYAEQGKVQTLLTLGVTALHQILEHVSGADLVNKVIALASSAATEAASSLAALGEVRNPADLETELASAEDASALLLKRSRAALGRATDVGNMLSSATERLDVARARNEEVRGQIWELSRLDASIRSGVRWLRDETAALEALENELRGLAPALTEYEAKAEQFRALEAAKRAHEKAAQSLDAEELALKALEEQLRVAIGERDKLLPVLDLPQALERKARLGAELRDVTRRLSSAEKSLANSTCPECGRPYDTPNERAALEDTLRWLREAETEASEKLSKAEQLVTRLERDRARRSAAETQVSVLADRLSRGNHSLKVAEAEVAEAEAVLRGLRKGGQPLSRDELDALKAAFDRAQQLTGEVRAKREGLDEADGRLEEQVATRDLVAKRLGDRKETDLGPLQEAVREQEKARERAMAEVAELREQAIAAQGTVRQLQRDLDVLRERARQAAVYAAKRRTAEALTAYLRTNRDRFMGGLWDQVTGYASSFASASTGGAISRVSRTDNGSFLFEEEGQEDDVVTASGAQRSVMSLGVQLALDALLPDSLGAILLDEPSADMDPAHAATVTQLLAQSGRQVVMVSHRELDASVAQAHIQLG